MTFINRSFLSLVKQNETKHNKTKKGLVAALLSYQYPSSQNAMEKPDQIRYLAKLQNLSIGEVQEDVGDYGTRCQREQGDSNALRALSCAHGSSLLRK